MEAMTMKNKKAKVMITAQPPYEVPPKANNYNGWTNYETWCTALWIDNDQGEQEAVRELAQDAYDNPAVNQFVAGLDRLERLQTMKLVETLKDHIEEQWPDLGASMWADLLNASFGEIDWYDLARHYLAEVHEEQSRE
jgi:hypothetical protein